MEKYGVDMSKVDQLIKLGIANSEESARELVAGGSADDLIKTAMEVGNGKGRTEEGSTRKGHRDGSERSTGRDREGT